MERTARRVAVRRRSVGKDGDSWRLRWQALCGSGQCRAISVSSDSFTVVGMDQSLGGAAARSSAARTTKPEGKGLGLFLKDGHLSASLVQRWLDDGVRVESEAAVPLNRWSHVILTYDGSRLASGVQLYLDGRPLATKVDLDYLNQPST